MHAFPRQLEVMQLNGSQSLSCKLGSPVYESLLVMRYLIALLCNPVQYIYPEKYIPLSLMKLWNFSLMQLTCI